MDGLPIGSVLLDDESWKRRSSTIMVHPLKGQDAKLRRGFGLRPVIFEPGFDIVSLFPSFYDSIRNTNVAIWLRKNMSLKHLPSFLTLFKINR